MECGRLEDCGGDENMIKRSGTREFCMEAVRDKYAQMSDAPVLIIYEECRSM
jgi:hypothetical protein